MIRMFERSLLLRVGLGMAVITLLAFFGMLTSVFIAETTQGEAAAVNQAGTLRMQSYRIAASLDLGGGPNERFQTGRLVREFEERLHSPRLINVIPDDPSNGLNEAYAQVTLRWRDEFKPLLTRYLDAVERDRASARPIAFEYFDTVDSFVAEIDQLVRLLENDAESNIRLLRLAQGLSLFLTLMVVFTTMHLMHTDILVRLRDLLNCAEAARRGDFSVRIGYVNDDELGRLGKAFNVMTEDLDKIYTDLERRVQVKTADLERSNRSLELLYNTTRRLNEGPLSEAVYRSLLTEIEKVLGLHGGAICLSESGHEHAYRLASTQRIRPDRPFLCSERRCHLCFGSGDTHEVKLGDELTGETKFISLPIADKERQYGVLLMEVPPHYQLESWQVQLLQAVADHIAIAIHMALRSTESRRLSLLEERSVIARELHDSLAQSLSYLKIQVSRLDLALKQPSEAQNADAIVQELREGVSSAYRQLRELLTTFRLKMDGRGLGTALLATVGEFQQRHPETSFSLDNSLPPGFLSANEEIHVLQIVREALANVAKHAHATHARVRLGENQGMVYVTMDDNGVGIPPEAERRNHYGMAIMLERAHGLGGKLIYHRGENGGTHVELRFAASAHAHESTIISRGTGS